jgi:capsular polysaccharide biosynthesis protein
MELREAFRRVLIQHWVLIGVLVVAGVVAAAVHAHQTPLYTASTRLVLGTDDPKSRTESGSIADTGKAIATSLTQVRRALEDANVPDRNPVEVAKRHVFVRALGTSGVVQLSVSDKDARIARDLANALAQRVIRVRSEVTTGQLQSVLSDLAKRVDELNLKISTVDQKIDTLNIQMAQARSATTANALRARRDDLSRQRDFFAQQRSVLESERISVLSSDALRPKASVISAASLPTKHDSSALGQEMILGALLGLVLGIGIAGLIETFRPTVVGSDSLAREFDTPLLGAIPTGKDDGAWNMLGHIGLRLRLAAEGVGAHSVGLVAVGQDVELGLLAATLDELVNRISPSATAQHVAALEGGGAAVSSDTEVVSKCRVRPFGLLDARPDANTALVLVSADVATKDEIDAVSHLLRVAGSPLLGLITYERVRERRPRSVLAALGWR